MNILSIFKSSLTAVFLFSAIAGSGQYTPKQQDITQVQGNIPTSEELNWFFENDLELSSYDWTDPVLNQQLQSALRQKKKARTRTQIALGFFAAGAALGVRALSLKNKCGGNDACDFFLTDAFSSMALVSGGVGLGFLISSGNAKTKYLKQLNSARSSYREWKDQ